MGSFTKEESKFKTPPEDTYWLDLIWIQEVEGKNGPYYRWYWAVADVKGQEEWKGCRATSQTTLTPTVNNRFGTFLDVLVGEEVDVGFEGSTEDIAMAGYRVKGFLEHKHSKGYDNPFCNITKLIEDSAHKGEGVGIEGAGNKLRESINEYLKKEGKPLLEISEEESKGKPKAKPAAEQKAPKKKELPW